MSQGINHRNKFLCENMSFALHEAYKRMRTNTIIALPQTKKTKVIGITSAQPGEGKSTTSINLAFSFSELGKSVLLIDADMRRPSIGKKLGLAPSVCLVDLLTDTDVVSDAFEKYRSRTENVSFDVICGKATENTSELLSSPRYSALMEIMERMYDVILIDLPPIGAVIDAVVAGKYADGVIVIAVENETPQKAFDNCIKQLEFAGIKILGVVFNGSLEGIKNKYGYGYGY